MITNFNNMLATFFLLNCIGYIYAAPDPVPYKTSCLIEMRNNKLVNFINSKFVNSEKLGTESFKLFKMGEEDLKLHVCDGYVFRYIMSRKIRSSKVVEPVEFCNNFNSVIPIKTTPLQ